MSAAAAGKARSGRRRAIAGTDTAASRNLAPRKEVRMSAAAAGKARSGRRRAIAGTDTAASRNLAPRKEVQA